MEINIPGFYKCHWRTCEHPKLGKGIELAVTAMYRAPNLGLEKLTALANYFGTIQIDIDNDSIDSPGCETCDYGSCYGHTIQVYRITKNHPEGKNELPDPDTEEAVNQITQEKFLWCTHEIPGSTKFTIQCLRLKDNYTIERTIWVTGSPVSNLWALLSKWNKDPEWKIWEKAEK